MYCKGPHGANECTVVTDKNKRHDIVREAKLCFNCLNNNHRVSQCKTKGRCKNCRRKHHTSLCSGEQQPKPHSHGQDEQDSTKKEVHKPYVGVINTTQTDETTIPLPADISSTSIQHLNEGTVKQHRLTVLKTAIAPVEYHGRSVNVRILFYEGSHRSFITSEPVEQLGSTPEREEFMYPFQPLVAQQQQSKK